MTFTDAMRDQLLVLPFEERRLWTRTAVQIARLPETRYEPASAEWRPINPDAVLDWSADTWRSIGRTLVDITQLPEVPQ